MIAAFAAALVQATPACAAAVAAADSAWIDWRRGDPAAAGPRFARADSLCPALPTAQVGLGFARLHAADPVGAARRFTRAITLDPSSADAWYGLGLAHQRLSRPQQAVAAWQRAIALAPDYRDVEDALLEAGADPRTPLPRPPRPATAVVPARTAGERFEVFARGTWQSFYVQGINLGTALPGRFPSQFPVDDSTYAAWLALMAAARANTVRVYTILPPAFYRAFRAWNAAHPEQPLWLVQGVWAEPPPDDDYDDLAWLVAFRSEMRRVVDVVHGRARIPARSGHAFGRFDADVSDRVLAFLIGREWEPHTLTAYNARAGRRTAYAGRFLTLSTGTSAEAWMAEQCDRLQAYEWGVYHAARPVAYTNWPTLDPMHHPTESTREEERALRRRLGLPPNPRLKEYDNDRESLDATRIRPTAANLGGWFAAFHAYPYYPDFIGLDSAYGAARSSFGRSHYLGYLQDLRRRHAGLPVLIAEYGVPSSRGIAHLDPEGWHHGGHDEASQAAVDARLTREIREAGLAGGIVFAWLDEWFKHNWVVLDLEQPAERNRLWHNVEDAEQHYGLLGQYAGSPDRPEPGGDPAPWRSLPHVERIGLVTLRAGADEAYLYLALAGAGERVVVGLDTYRPDRGQFRLPGVAQAADIGLEYALVVDGARARLLVNPDDNPFLVPRPGLGPTGLDRLYHFGATADARRTDGLWDSLWVTTNRFRIARDGRTFAARGYDRGRLRRARSAETSLADWWTDTAAGILEVRLPWTLLNVTDPSSRTVLTGIRSPDRFTVAQTDGVRFALLAADAAAWSPGGPTFAWPTWEQPRWHERLKPVYYALREVWEQ